MIYIQENRTFNMLRMLRRATVLLFAFTAGADALSLAEYTGFIPTTSASDLIIGRAALTGSLVIAKQGNSGIRRLTMSDEVAHLYPQHGLSLSGRLFLLAYNVETALPSGRRPGQESETNDLFEIVVDGDKADLKYIASIPMGIDVSIFENRIANSVLLCAQTICMNVGVTWRGSLATENIKLPPGQILIETAGNGAEVWGLMQTDFDDVAAKNQNIEQFAFSLCRISSKMKCTAVHTGGIPYRLKVEDGKPAYQIAESNEQLADLLTYDLDRLRGNGIGTYSEPNTEGRIAWSSVYYINGLIDLAKEPFPSEFLKLQNEASERVQQELTQISKIVSDGPGLFSRRYSVNREELLVSLHASRVSRLAVRGSNFAKQATHTIISTLSPALRFEGTLEQVGDGELLFRRGSHFWADGANTPWNFQSAWIETTSMLGSTSHRALIQTMIDKFIASELADKPVTWRYAGGVFDSGWDGISTNTPRWDGNKGAIAHISYRTMDAMALIEARRAGFDVPSELIAHFKHLVEIGALYPFMQEALRADIPLPSHTARVYARSVVPWHVQNQVWAIKALLKTP